MACASSSSATTYLHSLSVYETPLHFYIVGANASETRFSTLKVVRTGATDHDFVAGEPDHDYTRAEIGELLYTLSESTGISLLLSLLYS
jgi:hypothetical protein